MFTICEIKNRKEIEDLYKASLEKEPAKPIELFENKNTHQFRDVHVYDGKTEEIQGVIECSDEMRRMHLKNLQSLFVNNTSKSMIDILLSRNNYDPSNRVDSADLLVWICCHPITPDLFFLLEEQLGDNGALGTCLQGSSHRIRQIYYAQKDL